MTEPRRLRVLFVDDHAMVRRGLAAFLKAFDDLALAGEAAQGEEAVRRCAEVQPDVVLVDLEMPVMVGVAATRAIRERFPAVRVLALTSFRDEGLVQRRLVVSPSTAKAHVSSILSKLGITSRSQAVALAMQHHLVT